MVRWLTVLITLIAHCAAMISPWCFVCCTSADGSECWELRGHDCRNHRCSGRHGLHQSQGTLTRECGHQHEDECHDEHDLAEGWQFDNGRCSCQHTPLLSFLAVPANSRTVTDVLSIVQTALLPASWNLMTPICGLDSECSWRMSVRPHVSPHLEVASSTILRV